MRSSVLAEVDCFLREERRAMRNLVAEILGRDMNSPG
jgi:hypothetical protein